MLLGRFAHTAAISSHETVAYLASGYSYLMNKTFVSVRCGHCKKLEPEFKAAAKKPKKQVSACVVLRDELLLNDYFWGRDTFIHDK